jgi:prepilin-type N-terminal cleavage/methylation domain-containing protein
LFNKGQQRGFTFIGLLIVVAVSGIALAGAGVVWHMESQRERELELLFIGKQYQAAIENYYQASPAGIMQYPHSLEDLLLDKRFPVVKRHIRTLYPDPITFGKPWGLVLQQGNVIGVYSTSTMAPIKKSGFSQPFLNFSKAEKYSDWAFVAGLH